ncbi:hypothetical protein AB4305_04405 [Nocardia sp. 2YAB30]|uniref:hypothetical protein n=1 Tax=unclassified Nocardia TaxID=2637762 RepID=UPI003F9A36C7
MISHIEAAAQIDGLTVGDKDIQLRAAYSLSLRLAKTVLGLVSDLNTLQGMRNGPILPGLEGIEQLVALKANHPQVPQLHERLVSRLLGTSDEPIGPPQLAL